MWRWMFVTLALTGCAIEGPAGLEESAIKKDKPDAVVGEPVSMDPYAAPEEGDDIGSGGATNGTNDDGADDGGAAAPHGSPQVCYPGADGSYSTCLPLVGASSVGSGYGYPASSDPAYQAPLRFVDLDAVSPSLKLAPNFALGELMQAYKGQYGVFQVHMVETLQSLRDQTSGPLVIHSGYRSPGYNAGISGSATFSRHMYGDGADMHSEVVSLNSLKNGCQSHGADYVSLYTSHVHCDWRYESLDPSFYAASYAMSTTAAPAPPAHEASLELDAEGAWLAPISGFDEGEPYREWTAYDAAGNQIEVVAAASYLPPSDAETIEVMIGGQVTLQAPAASPDEWIELPIEELEVRLETTAIPRGHDHDHDGSMEAPR